MLLDPASPFDSALLWFDEDGRATSHPVTAPVGSGAQQRAETSISILNLNEQAITEARLISMLLVKRQYLVAVPLQGLDHYAAQQAFREACAEIIRRIRGRSEYSAANRAMLRSLDRGEDGLANELLANA